MKILKPGKVEQRKFVCPVCGCVFAASVNEMDEYTDFFTCPQEGCRFDAIDWEKNGELYEEHTPTISDVERLKNLIMRIVNDTKNWLWADLARGLIQNGVTFREGGE